MKKVYLLAGFFILTSSLPALANNDQPDTFPVKMKLQFFNISDIDLRLLFYKWRNLQQQNSLTSSTTPELWSPLFINASHNSILHLSWWPQVAQLNSNQTASFNYALAGFANGLSTGLSTANNYYFKNAYNWEVNKNFYSISSFLIGAGLGTALGLKDPR